MRGADRPDERGESLLELVVAVAILGVGVTALLGALSTAVFGSALHRKQADVSAVMTAAAEQVKASPYKMCAVRADYLGSFGYAGWSGTVEFAIADWNGTSFESRNLAASPADTATCTAGHRQGRRLQQVTITAVTADNRVRQSVPILKRFRQCPVTTPPTTRPGCD